MYFFYNCLLFTLVHVPRSIDMNQRKWIFIRNHVVSSSLKCISLVHKKSVLPSVTVTYYLNINIPVLLQLLKSYNL